MNTSLAERGLPEFVLAAKAVDGIMGVDSVKVQTACDQIDKCAVDMDKFIEDLTIQKEAILKDWEGEAANALRECFPKIISEFSEVPKSVKSISNWATSTKNAYVSSDMAVAAGIRQILGGNR